MIILHATFEVAVIALLYTAACRLLITPNLKVAVGLAGLYTLAFVILDTYFPFP